MNLVNCKMNDQNQLTSILTKSFNYDTALYFGANVQDGPPGYNDGSLAKKILANPSFTSFFIFDNQNLMGFISYCLEVRELHYFCLLPEFIGQGYGTNIWQMIEEKHGKEGWRVETPSYSIGNHYFYRKLGFEKIGEQHYSETAVSFVFEK